MTRRYSTWLAWYFAGKHHFALHDLHQVRTDPDHIAICDEATHSKAQAWTQTRLGQAYWQHP